MPYTMKLDWSGHRTKAVRWVLAANGFDAADLDAYIDEENLDEISTIKLDWPGEKLNEADAILEAWTSGIVNRFLLLRADLAADPDWEVKYESRVTHATHVTHALVGMRFYRQFTADAVAMLKEES